MMQLRLVVQEIRWPWASFGIEHGCAASIRNLVSVYTYPTYRTPFHQPAVKTCAAPPGWFTRFTHLREEELGMLFAALPDLIERHRRFYLLHVLQTALN